MPVGAGSRDVEAEDIDSPGDGMIRIMSPLLWVLKIKPESPAGPMLEPSI